MELYYKKYTGTVQASDYAAWAERLLHFEDVKEAKKLASMAMQKPVNLSEIENMFNRLMKVLQLEAPSEEECLHDHLKRLHAQLLIPGKKMVAIVQELYNCTIKHGLADEEKVWREIMDAINRHKHGDHLNSNTEKKINEMILLQARRLWHSKYSKITFQEFIGQKVTGVDSEVHFIIQFEQGAVTIECPWRIRNSAEIIIGETDMESSQYGWKDVAEFLVGKTIEDIQLLEHCPLLILQIGDIFVDVFHASSSFDGWTMSDDEEFYLFSMHGGHAV